MIIGIDPGASGGMACLKIGGEFAVTTMPKTEWDILEWLCCHANSTIRDDTVAYIELVGGFMGGNTEDNPHVNVAAAHTMFKFGQSYGMLRMACCAIGIRLIEAVPKTWQKVVGCPRMRGETKTEHKNRLKGKAQQLFPKVHVTLNTADALLIAYYGEILEKVSSYDRT